MSYTQLDNGIKVAKCKKTGLYLYGVLTFLYHSKRWITIINPSIEEVKCQLEIANTDNKFRTADLNDADIWTDYEIEDWLKYLPDVEFIPVTIRAV